MRVAAINGSPHGAAGGTQIVLSAFLEGCREGGAELALVQLAGKRLGFCLGCHACWTTSPGRCVQADDLASILETIEGAELVVLASPLHFLQVSGQLKVFIDRLTSTGGNPHGERPTVEGPPPRLAAIMSCGFPRPEQFRASSLWMEDLSGLLGRELLLEAYAAGARRLARPGTEAGMEGPAPTDPEVLAWLEILREAGRTAARGGTIEAGAKAALKRGFGPSPAKP